MGDVLEAQGKIGDALKAYRNSVATFERLAAAEPGNSLWQIQRPAISRQKVGGVLVAQGKLDDALKSLPRRPCDFGASLRPLSRIIKTGSAV